MVLHANTASNAGGNAFSRPPRAISAKRNQFLIPLSKLAWERGQLPITAETLAFSNQPRLSPVVCNNSFSFCKAAVGVKPTMSNVCAFAADVSFNALSAIYRLATQSIHLNSNALRKGKTLLPPEAGAAQSQRLYKVLEHPV